MEVDNSQQHTIEHQSEQPSSTAQEAAAAAAPAARQSMAAENPTGNVDKWWLSESSEDESDQEQQGSNDEDGGEGNKVKTKQQRPRGQQQQQRQQQQSDADLLYDPDADDSDEQWMQQQRQGHTTDAILSCPGCFTTLCIDCQQHAVYHTQYRAMITMNCDVKMDQVMHTEVKQQRQQQRRKRRAPDEDPQQQQQQQQQVEVLHPVFCAVCDTQVGAQDADEVVHFFHVLASES